MTKSKKLNSKHKPKYDIINFMPGEELVPMLHKMVDKRVTNISVFLRGLIVKEYEEQKKEGTLLKTN